MNENKSIKALLASVLSYVMDADEAVSLAEALMMRYGDMGIMSAASYEELSCINGMTPVAAQLIKLTVSMASRRVTDNFSFGKRHSAEDVENYLKALFLGCSVETVYMLVLDEKDRIMSCEYMGEGTVSASDIYPRKLLERAVKRRASSVIIAHNHPRGKAEASAEDILATNRLAALFHSSGVRFICHYVVNDRAVARIDGALE